MNKFKTWCVVFHTTDDSVNLVLVQHDPDNWWVINGAWAMPNEDLLEIPNDTTYNPRYLVMLNEDDCARMDRLRRGLSYTALMHEVERLAVKYTNTVSPKPNNDLNILLGDM